MPIKINDKYLVPAPLVTFNKNYLNSENGDAIGVEYQINLQGTLLPNKGNPVVDSVTFESSFSADSWVSTKSADDDPNHELDLDDSLLSIMSKQEEIRKLFSPGQAVKVEILDLNLRSGGKGIAFIGNVQAINFANEGRWVMPCPYTVDIITNNFITSTDSGDFISSRTEDNFRYFIRSASETWEIQEADQKYYRGDNTSSTLKVYNISHSINAVGQPAYSATGTYDNTVSGKQQYYENSGGSEGSLTQYTPSYVDGLSPWQQASGYVYETLEAGHGNFPGGVFTIDNSTFTTFGSSLFDNTGTDVYILADRTLTENIDIRGGAYSINESFVAIPSGDFNDGHLVTHENNVNVSRGEDGLTQVSIDGTIRGLNSIAFENSGDMGHVLYPNRHEDNSFKNAKDYYKNYLEANVGGSALASRIYHLARNASELNWLHPQYKSKSEGLNFSQGTITYNFTYDNRPPNIISGSITENIDIQDTHPGQIFANIPVIGRNQPVLQYLNSRSEYKRSLNISVSMARFEPNWITDSGDIISATGYWSDAVGVTDLNTTSAATNDSLNWWLYSKKPSITNTADFQKIFDAANPANETAALNYSNPVVAARCFHSAPTESWNPRTGQYSYSIEWTYERES